jgi:hypothetical protein
MTPVVEEKKDGTGTCRYSVPDAGILECQRYSLRRAEALGARCPPGMGGLSQLPGYQPPDTAYLRVPVPWFISYGPKPSTAL